MGPAVSYFVIWMAFTFTFLKFETHAVGQNTTMNFSIIPRIDLEEYNSQLLSDSISRKILNFGQKVGAELGKTYSQTQIFSPLSIMSVVALLFLGSRGDSYNELASLMGIESNAERRLYPNRFHEEFYKLIINLEKDISEFKNVQQVEWRNSKVPDGLRNNEKSSRTPSEHVVKIANALFVQHGITLNEDYHQAVQSIYRTKLALLDFKRNRQAAKNYINSWANQNTDSKIRKITDEISLDTNMIAANVLYFKGYWEKDFFESATSQSEFYPDGLAKPPVRVMMMATAGNFPYYESVENDCRIIGLPYKGNLSTLYIIQPQNSSRDKLRQLQTLLTADKIENMISKMVLRVAIIAFPKLHIKDSLNLKEILTQLGATSIFSSHHSDFTIIKSQTHSKDQLLNRPVQVTLDTGNGLISNRFNNTPLTFSRFGEEVSDMQILEHDAWNINNGSKRRLTSGITSESVRRKRRQIALGISKDIKQILNRLESLRQQDTSEKIDLYIKDIMHKVDLVINEQGTEAAAATVVSLKRSGPEVLFRAETPFLMVLRHDVTKLPLFYGVVNDPSNLS